MRILFLAEGDAETNDSWSGTSRRIVEGLRARGHVVVSVDCDLYGWRRAFGAALSWHPSRAHWRVRYSLGQLAFQLRSAIAQRAVDMCAETDFVVQVGATFLPRVRSTQRFVVMTDGNILLSAAAPAVAATDGAYTSVAALAGIVSREQRVYDRADVVVALSDRVARSCVEDFGVPAHCVRTMYAAPNLDMRIVPDSMPIPRDVPPTILFVGRQWQRKGGDLLLRAFVRVRHEIPEARLVVIGPRALPATTPGVEFMGLLDKSTPEGWARMARAYVEASVFCLPSRFEGFSIAVLEAMAFSRPCVTLSFPWMRSEMVDDGVTGFAIEGEDEDALVSRLVCLLRDPTLCDQMGKAAAEKVRTSFTWPLALDRFEDALRCGTAQRTAIPKTS